jgi:hypothetical protein
MKARGGGKTEPYLSFVSLIIEPSGVLAEDEFVISGVSYIFMFLLSLILSPIILCICLIIYRKINLG